LLNCRFFNGFSTRLNPSGPAANLARMPDGNTHQTNPRADVSAWWTAPRFSLWLGAALIAGFLPVVIGTRSFYFFDYGVLGYPVAFYHREAFWRGEFFPLWNPLSNCGVPFLAQWGTMALYPGALIYLLLPLPWSLGLFCLLHLFLGGLGMFFLARAWWHQHFAAALAGTAFAFSGAVLAALVWPNWTVALGWMPWVVWLGERAWREGGGRRIALAALAGAVQLLAGVPELVLFTWLVIVAIWLMALACKQIPAGAATLRLAAVLALIAALSLAQLLPFLELLGSSQRHAGFATDKWAMPLWGWGNLLVPLFHHFRTPQGFLFQEGQTFLVSYYPGVTVLVLAGLAVVWRRERPVWLLAGLIGLSLVLAWGERGQLYGWLRAVFPPLGIGRYTVKFVFVAALLAPLLAAGGMAWLLSREGANRARVVRALWLGVAILVALMFLVVWLGFVHRFAYDQPALAAWNALGRAAVLAAGAALVWFGTRSASPAATRGLQLSLLALIAADGLTHKPGMNPTLPAEVFRPGLVELKPPHAGEGRVMISPAAERALLRSEVADPRTDFTGKRLALWSNLNLLEGAPKVNGSATLQLRWQKEVQDLLYATNAAELPALMDFLAVTHATKPGTVVEWTPRSTALPWVTIGAAPVFADATDTLAALGAPGFDARSQAYLPPEARELVKAARNETARIVRQEFGAHRARIEVESPQPSLLVIAQSFHPAWRAVVDGKPAQVWRANHAFQAVELPAGARLVELSYSDAAFRRGAAITVAALALCGLLLATGGRRKTPASSAG
jgi:hypothetical protein